MSKSVLLLSGYDAVSHRMWWQRLSASFPEWQWTCLSLPPRHFSWRIRSNGLHWAYQEQQVLEQDYDLLIATSMVDLATLRGLCPQLAQPPTIVYFHENQFAYPPGRQRADNIEPVLVPIYSALCADQILFNSAYNRESFLKGVETLSESLPESLPEQALRQLRSAEIIPVALPSESYGVRDSGNSELLTVLWNHRWEYDKGPALLLAIVQACKQQNLELRFHIVGQQFRDQPTEFTELRRLLHDQESTGRTELGYFGYLAEADYRKLLGQCDVVLSTALHDFQGLAIQEACQAGCRPLAPKALAYPEYLPAEFLYQILQDDVATASEVAMTLKELAGKKRAEGRLSGVTLKRFTAQQVRAQYLALFSRLGLELED